MRLRLLLPVLILITAISAACAPLPSAAAATPIGSTMPPSPTASSVPASTATRSLAPETPTAGATPLPVVTSRGDALEATDPDTIALAGGGLQLVEFFAFW